MFREVTYRFALILSILLSVGSVIYGVYYIYNNTPVMILMHRSYTKGHTDLKYYFDLNLLIPLCILFFASISTISAVVLRWRLDRNQTKDLDLKVKDLDIKLKDLERNIISTQIYNTIPPTQQLPNI